MNQLKAKITIECNTCGCQLKRTKTIKVEATNREDATKEADQKIKEWKSKLSNTNCKTCQSIIDDLA